MVYFPSYNLKENYNMLTFIYIYIYIYNSKFTIRDGEFEI